MTTSARSSSKRMKLARLAALSAATALFLLHGCAEPQAFHDRDAATISFELDNDDPSDLFGVFSYADDYDCFDRSTVFSWLNRSKTAKVTLHRRPWQTISYVYVGGSNAGKAGEARCGGTYTFRADDSDAYRAHMTWVGANCTLHVQRKLSDGWAPVELHVRAADGSLKSEHSAWCKGDNAFAGSSRLEKPRGI
jgi:hypothetical protein